MLKSVIFAVVVEGALSDSVILGGVDGGRRSFESSEVLYVIHKWLLDIWIEEELLELRLITDWRILWRNEVLMVGRSPLVRLCDDKSLVRSLVASSSLLSCVVLRVLHVLHVWNDRLGVEAVLFICFELLLVELLALHPPRVTVLELREICVAGIVGLGWMVRHLRELRFLLVDVGPLKLFYFFHLFLLVLREGKQEILDAFALLQLAAQLLPHSSHV
jgi:hypothetical protein